MSIEVQSIPSPAQQQAEAAPATDSKLAATSEAQDAETTEPAEKEQSETPDTQEAEDSDTFTSEDEEQTDDVTDDDDTDGPKPRKGKGGFKRRIDKLNSKLSAKEQELAYWRDQALKGGGKGPEQQEAKEVAPEQKAPDKPSADDYDTHEDYIDALTDWKVEAKLSAQNEKARLESQQQEFAARQQSFQTKVQEFAKAHEDFNEVVDDVSDIALSVTVRQSILESENGPELMYQLSKNRAELERINALPAIAAARELGKFEARLQKEEPIQPKPKTTSKAPAPVNPVGSRSANASSKSLAEVAKDDDYEAYKRVRLEQMKQNRR